jgi:hypothetical protein
MRCARERVRNRGGISREVALDDEARHDSEHPVSAHARQPGNLLSLPAPVVRGGISVCMSLEPSCLRSPDE